MDLGLEEEALPDTPQEGEGLPGGRSSRRPSGREEKLCVLTVRRRQGRRSGRGNVGYLRCNQIVNGLESEVDRVAVNVAGTGFLSRTTAERIWCS